MKNNIATLIVIVMLAVFALPAKAQFNQYHGAVAPQASFQSTSAMRGSGSAYRSNPVVSSYGTAVYTPSTGTYRARKADLNGDGFDDETGEPVNPNPWGDQIVDNTDPNGPGQPIGDALLPLMLCALAYLIFRTRKRAKGERANGLPE